MNSNPRIITRDEWQPWLLRLLALAVFAVLPACSDNGDGAQDAGGGDAQPFADTFLQIGGPAFEAALVEEMRQQREAHPGRTQTFLPVGNDHTFVQLEPDKTAGGVNLMDWIGFMLDGSEQWVSVDDFDE